LTQLTHKRHATFQEPLLSALTSKSSTLRFADRTSRGRHKNQSTNARLRYLVLGSVVKTSLPEVQMEELNGRMIACQILITGLIAKIANDSKDPLRFLTTFRDEILAVVRQVRIAGALDATLVRRTAEQTVDELFSLMKPPSTDE
jgi:hypothetical protein